MVVSLRFRHWARRVGCTAILRVEAVLIVQAWLRLWSKRFVERRVSRCAVLFDAKARCNPRF
ncbi:hypothetical protein FHY15_002154 [Xanthomonas arboricola]|nr:hypothetical protein [Xanthomonas arboricola]